MVLRRLGRIPGVKKARSAINVVGRRFGVIEPDRVTRAQLATTRTELAKARSALRQTRATLRDTRSDLRSTRAELARIRAAGRQAEETASEKLRQADAAAQQARTQAREAERAGERARAEVTRFGAAYRRMLAAVRSTVPWEITDDVWSAPNHSWDRPYLDQARSVANDARLTRLIREGRPLDEAIVEATRSARWMDYAEWRALCQGLAAREESRIPGVIGAAIVAERAGLRDLVWDLLSGLPAGAVGRFAPAEYLRAGIGAGSQEAVKIAISWIEAETVTDPATLLTMARLLFVADEPAAAQDAVELFDRIAAEGDRTGSARVEDQLRASVDYLRPWIRRKLEPSAPPALPAGQVSFAVLDYKGPDEETSSSNIGDYVQTIAGLGHLLRHADVRLHGDAELVGALVELQQRVRADHRVAGPGADVAVSLVQRDASHLDPIPENTWALAFGWYLHGQFDLHWDFPFHPNLRPIFVSFHCNKPRLLTDEVVDYLKQYAPIGCRDWTTVHLLLNAGVPAFFSGCITTTIDTFFAEQHPRPPADAPVAYVDIKGKVPDDAVTIAQSYPEVRLTPAPVNLRRAVELLDSYRSDYRQLITSRLHCYLPSWSIGADVIFRPKNKADIRFAGLLDADADDLRAMQQRIRTLLEPVLTSILTGAPADQVYALWRELTADLVQHARTVFEQPAAQPTASFDLDAACRAITASRVVVEAARPRPGKAAGAEINVAVALDGNLRDQLPVVIAGVVDNTERPVRIFALTRDHGPEDHQRLAALYPETSFEFYPCDQVDYGPVLGMLKHITVSTMDRLLLPRLVTGADKVIYHDIDALAVHDVAELFDLELGDAPLAGRPSMSYNYKHGLSNLLHSTRLLGDRPEKAREFVHAMAQRHTFGFRTFNAGILLLNLSVMRADRFTESFVPYVENYGLNDQEVLNAYAGSRYLRLDRRWNAWPTQEVLTEPSLLHWVGPVKPWNRSRFSDFRDRWEAAEARVAARRS